VRIFSSASDAPRARRPTDLVLLVLAIAGVALISVPAPGPTAIDTSVSHLVADLPGLAGWFWEIAYDALIGWALVLLILPLFAHRRLRLFLDEVLAGTLALGFALLVGRIGGTDWGTTLRATASSHAPAVYLAVRLAIATAIVVTASPHLGRPIRYIGRWVVGVGAFSTIAVGVALPIGVFSGFVVGIGVGALVHLVLGSPGGRPTLEQVAASLRDLGVEATDLMFSDLELRGVALVTAKTTDGRSLLAKIYGRDAWDGQFITTTWSSLWNRGQTPSVGTGRLQQVEHEAFLTLMAERGGCPVLPVMVAGMAAENDALLVIETTGRSFSALDPGDVGDALLHDAWSALARLHGLGIAHGHVDGERLVVRPDGSAALGDFRDASVAADRAAMLTDRVRLLVTTAVSVGGERALAAAADALGAGQLGEMLPYLQPAVLDRVTRKAVHDLDWSLKDLRALAAERSGIQEPELEKLRRVSLGSIAVIVVLGLVAYAVIGALAQVGLQTLIDEFRKADMAWLLAALLLTPVVQVPQAFSTLGATLRPIRFMPVFMLQYAVQFISLAVPSSAARIALEVRFFERNGVPGAGAISIGAIDSFSTFLIQVATILIVTLSGLGSLNLKAGGSANSSGSGSSIGLEVLAVGAGLLVAAFLLALAVPRFRSLVKGFRDALRAKAADARDALRVLAHPSKLLLLFAGNLTAQVMLAIILGLCLRAFGYSASLADLLLVNTFVALFAGFMPVPGGVGVAEAAYTAGLVGIGIPHAAALSTAIAVRILTFYLPPIWGAFSMKWLRTHSYL
jgi:uncharacterized membrane protein YbhN (UPF0104 family)